MINRLPWHKKLRTSAANNLDKINEIIDYINHSDISDVNLSESGTGEIVEAGKASSLKDLTVDGKSVQNGTPTPEAPIPVQVVEGRNLLDMSNLRIGEAWNAVSNPNRAVVYIDCEPNTTYTISVESLGVFSTIIVYQKESESAANVSGDDGSQISNTNKTSVITTSAASKVIGVGFSKSSAITAQDFVSFHIQLELGSTATPYVPYGCIGLQIDDTVTPIDLQGNALASLPNGTKDVLKVDSAGHVTIEKRVGYIASYDDESVGDVYISTTGELSAGASVYYKLDIPTTIDLGYIEPPAIENDDEIQIIATLTPNIAVSWWSYSDITELITDLKAYVDYKTADDSDALGMHSLNPINIREDLPTIEPVEIPDVLESEE